MSKHGPPNGGAFEFSENFKNHQSSTDSTMVNKYHSVDARYNSIKNLPPDLRMKLRETLRQKIENKDTTMNNFLSNNLEIKPSSVYKTPPNHYNVDENGVGKKNKTPDFLNPYKSPPFSEAFYQVIQNPRTIF